ncbi:MAG: hypothetical protein M1383_05135 [Patescibacteria group bacterium]|nr:hypothetical protein [Patescibacteria group bacterium]
MRKFIAGLAIVAVALGMGGTASAASISNVSDDSLAAIVNNWLASLSLSTTNTATIGNTVTSTANSGGNTVISSDDQTNTVINTGEADSASVVDNAANQNEVTEYIQSSAASADNATNIGDESSATITTTDTVTSTETDANTVGNVNAVAAVSQTGGNAVSSGDSLDCTGLTTGLSQAVTGVTNSFNITVKKIVRKLRSF